MRRPVAYVAVTYRTPTAERTFFDLPYVTRFKVTGTSVLIAFLKQIGEDVAWTILIRTEPCGHELIQPAFDHRGGAGDGVVVLSQANVYFAEKVIRSSLNDPSFKRHGFRKPLRSKHKVVLGELIYFLARGAHKVELRRCIHLVNDGHATVQVREDVVSIPTEEPGFRDNRVLVGFR